MKKIKLLILLPLMLLTSCSEDTGIYVTSKIVNKYNYQTTTMVMSGKVLVPIITHHYIFQFNEVKPYSKSVGSDNYDKYEIGDDYTFQISEKEKEYFFETSYVDLN